jgi:hypothetical protein
MINTVDPIRISKIGVTPDMRGVASRRKIASEAHFPLPSGSTFPPKLPMLAASIPDVCLPPDDFR